MREVLSRKTVKKVLKDGKDCGARLALICSDCLIFVKAKDKKFSCRLVVWRAGCTMDFLPAAVGKSKYGCVISSGNGEEYTILVDSVDEQKEWAWLWQK